MWEMIVPDSLTHPSIFRLSKDSVSKFLKQLSYERRLPSTVTCHLFREFQLKRFVHFWVNLWHKLLNNFDSSSNVDMHGDLIILRLLSFNALRSSMSTCNVVHYAMNNCARSLASTQCILRFIYNRASIITGPSVITCMNQKVYVFFN